MVHENDGRYSPAKFRRKLGNPAAKLGAAIEIVVGDALERTE